MHRSSVETARGVENPSRPQDFGPSEGRADACPNAQAVATYELISATSDSRARMTMQQVMPMR